MKSLVSSILFFAVSSAFASPSIMLTGFKPFGDRTINTSFMVAQDIQSKLGEKGIDVILCELPVIYGDAFEIAKNCYQQLKSKPNLVISFGEQGLPKFEIEQAALNFAGEYPDEKGVIWGDKVIDANGPQKITFSLNADQLYCSMTKKQKNDGQVSPDPGDYLCNYVAFTMAEYMKTENIPFTFIHVPVLEIHQSLELHHIGTEVSRMIREQIFGTPTSPKSVYQQCLSSAQQATP